MDKVASTSVEILNPQEWRALRQEVSGLSGDERPPVIVCRLRTASGSWRATFVASCSEDVVEMKSNHDWQVEQNVSARGGICHPHLLVRGKDHSEMNDGARTPARVVCLHAAAPTCDGSPMICSGWWHVEADGTCPAESKIHP
jgi:hypothetical protein